jgi:hypothetical protein
MWKELQMIRKLMAFCAVMLILAACAPARQPTSAPEVVVEATAANPTEGAVEVATESPVNGEMDACALITQAEAEQTLGKATGPGQPEVTPPIYACSYETSDFDLVQIVVVIYDDNTQAQDAYQMAIDINGYPELSDLGDRAYNAQPIFDVNVLRGNLEISIDVSDSSDDQAQLQKAIDLARLVLIRLP